MIHCSFDGRLTRNAEVKTTSNGKTMMVFDVATNHGYGDKKKTIYIRCSMWERGQGTLEKIANTMTKGLFVMVHGVMFENEYKDKTGNDRKSLECTVNDLDRIGLMFKHDEAKTSTTAVQSEPKSTQSHTEEDIPF